MGRRHRMNGRAKRAISQIQNMRRTSIRAVRQMQHKKGKKAESVVEEAMVSLHKKNLIKSYFLPHRYSFMDSFRKVDKIVLRLSDGMPVPISVKSSFPNKEEIQKYQFFVKKFGKMPVFMIVAPKDYDSKEIEEELLRKVNAWDGKFKFEGWQLKYSKFFDFYRHPEFGNMKWRLKLFFSDKFPQPA